MLYCTVGLLRIIIVEMHIIASMHELFVALNRPPCPSSCLVRCWVSFLQPSIDMGLFSKKKEQTLIPEPARPDYGRTNSGTGSVPKPGGKDKHGNPMTEVRERKYGREAASYNPQSTAGSYGSYGNYGQPQQQQQQQPGAGYGYAPQGDSRAELFKGARAPTAQTGSGFDRNAMRGPAGSAASSVPSGGSRPEWADDDDEGQAGESGQQEQATEEDDEV
jgi:hypothetical protein